eukprot:3526517-Pleurochrysis_carterae.AAC.4
MATRRWTMGKHVTGPLHRAATRPVHVGLSGRPSSGAHGKERVQVLASSVERGACDVCSPVLATPRTASR